MYHNIIIPEHYPARERIAEALDKVLYFAVSDTAFLDLTGSAEKTEYVLTILIERNSSQALYTIREIADKIFEDLPFLHYELYTIESAEISLSEANLYFISLFTKSCIIYQSTHSKIESYKASLALNNLLKKSKRRYLRLLKKINELLDGAHWYLENGSFQLSADALYQGVYLLFRLCEEFYVGKSQLDGGLLSRQEFLNRFNPDFFTILNQENNTDVKFADRLAKAYHYYHTSELRFNKEEIDGFYVKADALYKRVYSLFTEYLDHS